ncbi:MAG: type IX secretion system protein PorQ [Fimbriimonadaceae bacterium]|nr:type IX secretion system protein PorQ [Chitinophagales bacterium]
MRIIGFSISIFLYTISFAQHGGSYTYQYLNLSNSARIAALGGTNISMFNDDVNFGWNNPALYNETMDGKFSVSHAIMRGNINHGYVAYGKYIDKWDATIGGGILYQSYGQMPMTDETGAVIGKFSASEYAIQGGIAHSEKKLSYGANVKLLYSQLESYNSLGAAIDIGGAFIDTTHQFSAGLVIKNIGTQFISYTKSNHEELPFQIQAGISKRLKYLPLRFSITAHNLQTFDIRYNDPNAQDQVNIFATDSASEVKEQKFIADKIFRHVIFAGEFYFGKNFNVRAGYDYLTAKEMSLVTKRGFTGFSLGFGMQIKRFQIDYAHEFHSVAGGSNMITIATNLNEFVKKDQPIHHDRF